MNKGWGIYVKNTKYYTLAILIIVGLIAAVESTGTFGTAKPEGTAVQQYPVASFNETPVQYAQVNGVTLG
jgi:hypothetical protein